MQQHAKQNRFNLPYDTIGLALISVLAASLSRTVWVQDTGGYYRCAVALAEGGMYPTDNYYFAYPLLIALSFPFFGRTLLAVHAAPFICAVCAPLLLFAVGMRAGLSRKLALVAGGMLVVYPLQPFHVYRPLTEAIFVFFLVLALWLFLCLRARPRAWLVFLPLLSWLLLIRYDAILFALLAGGMAGLRALKERSVPWRWALPGLLLAILVQVPFAMLNAERTRSEMEKWAAVSAEERTAAEAVFAQALSDHLAPIGAGSEATVVVDREPIERLYQELIPEPRLPLGMYLGSTFNPNSGIEMVHVGEVNATAHWLPFRKIMAWLNVGNYETRSWLLSLWKSFVDVFPLWGVLSGIVVFLGLALSTVAGLWSAIRHPSWFATLAILFLVLYSALAIFFIQGSLLRHMARVAPVIIFVGLLGVRQLCGERRKWWPGVSLFVLACVSVNAAHQSTRPDLVHLPLWRMFANNLSLVDYRGPVDMHLGLTRTLANPNLTSDPAWNLVYEDAFLENRYPATNHLWSAQYRGALGLSGSMHAAHWTHALALEAPIERVRFSGWAFQEKPNLVKGDQIVLGVSTNQGATWTERPLPAIKQRVFEWEEEWAEEVQGAREVLFRVGFRNYGQCYAYVDGVWYQVFSRTPGFYGSPRAQLERQFRVEVQYLNEP